MSGAFKDLNNMGIAKDDILNDDNEERPLHPMIFGNNSTNDLKKQLNSLEKKLNLNSIKPVLNQKDVEPKIHMPFSIIQQSQFNNSNNENNSMINNSNNLNNQISHVNTDKSVDFLSDLSDGLLVESRRLTYENRQFKKKVQNLNNENENLKTQLSNLNIIHNQLSKNEEKLNDDIWKLQTDVGTLEKTLEKNKLDLSSSVEEISISKKNIDQLKITIDTLNNQNKELNENSSKTINKLNSQIIELKDSNDNLNDENDILHKNIINLKSELQNLKSQNNDEFKNINKTNDTTFSDFDDSIIQDPLPDQLFEDLSNLDTDTLKNNIKLLYNQINKLRLQNHRYRKDLLNSKNKKLSPTKSIKSNKKLDNSWGDFNNDSFVNPSSNIQILPDDLTNSNDTDFNNKEVDMDIDNYLDISDMISQSSDNIIKKNIVNKSKTNYMLIVPKTTLESTNYDLNLKQIDLSEFKTISLSDDISTKLFLSSTNTTNDNDILTNENKLQILPKNEIDNLTNQLITLKSEIENPSMEYIESKCNLNNMIPLPIDNHKQMDNEIIQLKKINEDSISKINDISNELNQKSEEFKLIKNKLDNPDIDYIKNKSSVLNLIAIDNQHHKEMESKISSLEFDINKFNKQISDYKSKDDNQNREITRLTNEKSDIDNNLNKLSIEFEALNSEYLNSKQLLTEKESEISKLTEIRNKLQIDITHKETDLQNLKKLYDQPDKDYILSKSTSLSLIAINISEHEEIINKITELEKSLLKSNTELTIVKSQLSDKEIKINELLKTSDDQDTKINELERLIENLRQSSSEFENTISNLELKIAKPDLDYIINKASIHDLVALPTNEHNLMKQSHDSIEPISLELGNFKEENNKLLQDVKQISKELTTAKQELNTTKAELDSIKYKFENPDKDYIYKKASLHELSAIPMIEHESMKEIITSNKDTIQKYKEIEEELIQKHTEVKKLKKSEASLTESIEMAKKTLDLNEGELKLLKSQLESPTSDYIKEKSNIHNLIVLPADEHTLLQKQLAENAAALEKKERELISIYKVKADLEKQSSITGQTTVSLELHESVQKSLEEKTQEAEIHKKQAENLNEIKKILAQKDSELTVLIARAGELEAKAARVDEMNFELDTLKNVETELSKKREEIESMVDEKEKMLLKISSLEIKEKKLQSTLDDLDKANSELSSIKSSYKQPDINYIEEKSKMLGYIPVPIIDHDSMTKNLSDYDNLKESNNELSDKIVDLSSKYNTVNEANFKLKEELKILEELKEKLNKPSVKYIEDKSSNLGLVVLPTEEHQLLKKSVNDLSDQIHEIQNKVNDVEKEKKELNKQIEQLHNPTAEFVKSKSTSLGMITIPIIEHKQRESDLNTKNNEAKKQLHELNDLKMELAEKKQKLNDALANLEEFKKSITNIDYLKEKLALLNYVAVSETDFENVKLSNDELNKEIDTYKNKLSNLEETLADKDTKYADSISTIKKIELELKEAKSKIIEKDDLLSDLSKKMEETIISCEAQLKDINQKSNSEVLKHKTKIENIQTKLDTLKQSHISEVEDLVANNELTKQRHAAELESLKNENSVNDSMLHDYAKSKGIVLVNEQNPSNVLQKGITMQKSSSVATVTSENLNDLTNQSFDVIVPYIEKMGYTVLPTEEYEALCEKITENGDILDNLANISHEAEDIESDLESKKNMLEELESHSKHSIRSSNSSIYSISVPVETILGTKADKLKENIMKLNSELEDLKHQKTKINKQINRLSVASSELIDNKLTSSLSKKITKIENGIEVKQIELKSQQSALEAVIAYINKSKDLDLAPIATNTTTEKNANGQNIAKLQDEITQLQKQYDSKIEKISQMTKQLNESSEPKALAERLMLLGYDVKAPSNPAINRLKEISENPSKVSVNSIAQSEYFDAVSNNYDLETMAKNEGFILVPASEAKAINSLFKIEDIPFTDLETRLNNLGYVAVKKEEWSEIIAKSKEAKAPKTYTVHDLQQIASTYNLHVISEDDITRLKRRKITTKDLNEKASELNLKLLTQDEVDKLENREPITVDNLISKGEKLNYLCIPKDRYVATTVSRTPDIPNVTVVPNSFYNILLKSHQWYKENKNQLVNSPSVVPETISENYSTSFTSNKIALNLPKEQTDLSSLASVDTILSNHAQMTRLIMETNAGEYLYKYYRRMGPLSSVSNGRHQRYFWLHPYTVTLYWSIGDPSEIDPSKAQIKAISIIDVKSVDDNTPLPPGLYHKSIVIKSHEKTMKITCPTRQRHNIWFNAIKYLLDQSTSNLINDDNLEDQYLQDFSLDKKTEVERTQSMRQSMGPPRTRSLRQHPKSTSIRSISSFR